jgi:hypothetical protein
MKRTFCVLFLSWTTLAWGCATPRERRAKALRTAQAKLGHYPKSDFIRKYGNPRQCRVIWTGETCEFYKHRGLTNKPSDISQPGNMMADQGDVNQGIEMVSIDFDHDGYSTSRDAAAGY